MIAAVENDDDKQIPGRQLLAAMHLCSLYHHLVDAGRWSEFASVFAPGAEFRTLNGVVRRGPDEIASSIRKTSEKTDGPRPIAHHSTNVVVTRYDDRTAAVESKYFAIMSDGTTVSGLYEDTIVVVGEGWRIASRIPRRLAGPPVMAKSED